MKVAIFRAQEDGDRTAELLAARGHEAVQAPVFAIGRTGQRLPDIAPDAVLFTSRHGAEAVADDLLLPRLLSLPCFCVGARTAAEARRRGFSTVHIAAGDGTLLAKQLVAAFPNPSRFLFATGQHRKPTLERHLLAAGHQVDAIALYEASAVAHWSPSEVVALRDRSVTAALHYSRRSAELALALAAQAGLSARFRSLTHHCIGPDVAVPLQEAGMPRVKTAVRPDEEALIATLEP